jgi:mevalonate kinase
MRWQIPAKTFLLGEYAAVAGGSAIILTTNLRFELSLSEKDIMEGIHPDSPAGQWWMRHRLPGLGLIWRDPYQGKGGLGASSAQFIGSYLAICYLLKLTPSHGHLLDAYHESSWRGEGLRPSGYDVLAQTQNHCVYINRQNESMQSYQWAFDDIAFLLLHSGQKLETHYHLQHTSLPSSLGYLSAISDQAREAFATQHSARLIQAINDYHKELVVLNLVAQYSLQVIQAFKEQPDVLAAKGCGALGADVLLLIVPRASLATKIINVTAQGWDILATSDSLYTGCVLLKNKTFKTLDILP